MNLENQILDWEEFKVEEAARADIERPPRSPELSAVHSLARQFAREKLQGIMNWCNRREKNAPRPKPETVLMRFLVATHSLAPDKENVSPWQEVARQCCVKPAAVQKEAERFRKHFLGE